MANGNEPIAGDELLFRRVPEIWYDHATGRPLHGAFAPHKTRDTTGLSLARNKYKTVEEAAVGQPGKKYYVAVLRASDVAAAGMTIVPRPSRGNPSHCECTDLRADNCKSPETLERQRKLVELCLRVEGPYPRPIAPGGNS